VHRDHQPDNVLLKEIDDFVRQLGQRRDPDK
jgi:hypothetical protein